MRYYSGYLYALMAAIFNAMIGIFSVKIMETDLSPYAVAFFKCFISLIILTNLSFWFIMLNLRSFAAIFRKISPQE